MPTNYTSGSYVVAPYSATWIDPIQEVANGDAGIAQNVDVGMEALACRDAYLKTKTDQLAYSPVLFSPLMINATQASISSSSKTPTGFSPVLAAALHAIAGDSIKIHIGPITCYVASLVSTLGLLFEVAEGANPPTQYYITGTGITSDPVQINTDILYTVINGTLGSPETISLTLFVVADGSNAISASTPQSTGTWDASAGSFSPTNYIWGNYSIYRGIV